VSEPVKKIIGYSSEEMIKGGTSLFFNRVIPDDYFKVKRFFISNMLAQDWGGDPGSLDFRMERKNGGLAWLECKFFRNIEVDPDRKFLIGILKDITQQELCEQFLWRNLEENIESSLKLRKIKRNYKYKFRVNPTSKNFSFSKIRNKFPIKINKKLRYITKREKEVLELISFGYSSKQIANLLRISYHTVVTHRNNLISKFQVHNTAELIKKALISFCL
jgi:PAS domain S-box-containing protein